MAMSRVVPKEIDTPVTFLSLEGFLMDREAANLSPRTLRFYEQKVSKFLCHLAEQGVKRAEDISPNHVRRFLVALHSNHSPGGVHAYYRAIKAFCRWLYAESEIPSDIMRRIRPPKVPEELLEPVSMEVVQILLDACDTKHVIGARDYAIILTLLDTGLRASEFLALDVGDLDLETASLKVRQTKGRRERFAFLGSRSLQSVQRYLGFRDTMNESPLWAARNGRRLSYTGLRDVLRRRSAKANIEAPTLHSFRRAFALLCLRQRVDVYSLQRLMGHADLSVLRRYLAQTQEDLRKAHQQASPADNLPLHGRNWLSELQ